MPLGFRARLETPVPLPGEEAVPIRRVMAFLASIRSVYLGQGCLTEVGSTYLGVTHRFPTMEEEALAEAPADVRPLRGKALAEAAGQVRAARRRAGIQ